MIRFIYFFIFSLVVSCSNDDSRSLKRKVDEKKHAALFSRVQDCLPKIDTVFNIDNSIKCVVVDSFFTVKIKIAGIDSLLPYKFDCTAPKGLVPVFYSFSTNVLCLIRGYGFNYREFILGYVENGRIKLKEYETALTTDLSHSLVVYKNDDRLGRVLIEDFRTGKKREVVIPKRYSFYEIPAASINQGKLKLTYTNGSIYFSAY